jgi:hypothetical protein
MLLPYPKTRRQTEITARRPLAAVKNGWISKMGHRPTPSAIGAGPFEQASVANALRTNYRRLET